MNILSLFIILIIAFIGYFVGRSRANSIRNLSGKRLTSISHYYGYYVAIWSLVPAAIVFLLILIFNDYFVTTYVLSGYEDLENSSRDLIMAQIENTRNGIQLANSLDSNIIAAVKKLNYIESQYRISGFIVVLSISAYLFVHASIKISPSLDSRKIVERVFLILFFLCSLIAILTTVGIVISLLFETLKFFNSVPILDFLFGLNWSPQRAFVSDASELVPEDIAGAFGALPLFAGTFLIAFVAMCIAIPVGLLSAIYMAEYASSNIRNIAKPLIEILAGIPTVVYGFFAALTVAPFVRNSGMSLGLEVSSESALAAGFVMGIMIIPFVSSLSDDVLNSVPRNLREGSYAMGSTKSETIIRVLLPAALPGIIGSFLLAISRAIGETMIVVMAAGLAAKLTANPLDAATTITTQIVVILIGDQEFDSPKTQAAFALGLTLFIVTLLLNYIALRVVKKYSERYE